MSANACKGFLSDALSGINEACSSLSAEGYSLKLSGFSAIDRYLGLPPLPFVWAETGANIAVLAKFIENLRFPGMDIADGAVDIPAGSFAAAGSSAAEGSCYFRCLDNDEQNKVSFPLLSFTCDWQTGRFQDPLGIYPLLRKLMNSVRGNDSARGGGKDNALLSWEEAGFAKSAAASDPGRCRLIMDASLLMARYPIAAGARKQTEDFYEFLANCPEGPGPGPEAQRAFLVCLLVSPRPQEGFGILKKTGFLKEFWPELSGLDDVDHSKEFHPEGNVWNHTLETFRHRKPSGSGAFDLRLSLGLLLHDAGKPIAASSGSRRFDGHAELGAAAAARFLERLGFGTSLVQDIFYLVKNHMLPAALKRLPLAKTKGIMASPLFPTLLELYRCDESSSFKGLDDFYKNSAAYQNYLRNIKNPYRSEDGKKVGKSELKNSFGY